jgi:hemin uptake protein HemP
MPAAPNAFDVLSHPSLDHSGGGRANGEPQRPAALLESSELFGDGKIVYIMHNGARYRLQATKLGKLILTK